MSSRSYNVNIREWTWTTRGFKEKEFEITGNLIADILDSLKISENNSDTEKMVFRKVKELTVKFPIYHSK